MDIDPRRSLSQKQFCWVENMSSAKYFALKRKGLGPRVDNIDGLQRISPESRQEWHKRMAELAQSEAAQLEAERRRELAIEAGRAAAKSPLHVSKRKSPRRKRREAVTP